MHLNFPRLVREFLHGEIPPLMVRQDDEDGKVSTSVLYVYKTASKTFDGPAVYITQSVSSQDGSRDTATSVSHNRHTTAQATQEAPTQLTTTKSHTPSDSKTTPLLTASLESSKSTSQHASSQTSSTADPASSVDISGFSAASTTASIDSALAAGGSASTSSTSSSASDKPEGGMSAGAKAGLAIAIIIVVAVIIGIVSVIYRRKKQLQEAGQRLDDEKGAMKNQNHSHNEANDFLMMPGAAATVNHSGLEKAPSTAPRLSLRPVTQLFGFTNPTRKSTGSPLDLASYSGPTMPGVAGAYSSASTPRGLQSAGQTAAMGDGAGPQSSSAWEKMGQRDHANDPSNPFGDHAQSRITSPPAGQSPNALDSPAKADSPTLATDAAAGVAAAAASAATSAAASRPQQSPPHQQRSIVPKPLSIKSTRSVADGPVSPVPASPTMTEVSEAPSSVVGGVAAAASAGALGPAGPNNVHRVQLDFKPSMDDELEIRAGQLVRMLHAYDDGWALCVRMDRSHQGVVPRTCLSTHPVKPRSSPNGQGPRGPPSGPPRNSLPRGPPRGGPQMGPPGGRNSPGPYGPPARPMTSNGRNSPGPQGMGPRASFGSQPRPGSPGMRSPGPGGRARSGSVPRSMSPGYGGGGRPQMGPGDSRRRSNSTSQLMGSAPGPNRNSPPGLSPLSQGQNNFSRPQRKPVPEAQ